MFSKTCEYAIRALIFIAQKSKDGSRISIKDISSGIDSPEYFIAKILQDLSRKGFVQSAKGPNGGFYMDDANLEQSVADIVREIDGDKLFSGCGLGLKECSEDHPCPIHNDFKHIRQEIKTMLEESRIQLFVENLDLKLTFLKQ
ncbi:RrF2 family transcriptional regulator [Epilithonimonas vandammei]|jgi:Rrf2 family protein|uniref:Rrf2 family transcriptional regulator n=1 Tax=Epilithonimonas vandammei TaxID=2487072 RepID=A0A3G8Y5S4_9FLAO|nr:Rrf2 family transcriptional regulator [Epilithonimonas vandammei]AZI40380.1 Rrf2 family transcriptional regulator [Epilithonimonas vandammei]